MTLILKSLNAKILLLIIISYSLSLSIILFFTDRNNRKMIEEGQLSFYRDKLQLIMNDMQIINEKLRKTGLVEAYRKDFQENFLLDQHGKFYIDKDQEVYPFIVDENLTVMLHPSLPFGSRDLSSQAWSSRMRGSPEGDFTAEVDKVKSWIIFAEYSPWKWKICYVVPLSLKFQDSTRMKRILFLIMSISLVLTITFTSIVLKRMIRPISRLSAISRDLTSVQWDPAIPLDREDELGILAQNFHDMQIAVLDKITALNEEIAARIQIEGELKETRNYVNDIINSLDSAIIGINGDLEITRLNRRAENIFQLEEAKALGGTVTQCIPLLEPHLTLLEEALAGNTPGKINQVPIGEEESRGIFDISFYPLRSEKDRGVVIRIDDITEKIRLEEQLAQSRKMDAIGQLAGGIAHDFNNMLGGIMSSAEILQQQNPEAGEYLDLILEASEKAASLVKRLMTFGRKSDLTRENVDMHRVIGETLSILDRTIDRKVTISQKLSAANPFITADSSSIQNILLNMAINASHAMKGGGDLFIKSSNTVLNETYCRLSPFELNPGEYLLIEIRDTGTGIPPEILSHIFEPFFTTKEVGKGTGLGLFSAYGTVVDHGGAITVYSEVGEGTAFHLYFPCSGTVRESAPGEENDDWKGSGTVLLVDDENLIRQTTGYLLENLGFGVILAEDGEEALALFNEKKGEISLVITDMIMPRLNGRELFYAIQEADPGIPVVITSGFTQNENIRKMQEKGLAGFIQKPFNQIDLTRILKKIRP